MTAADTTAAAVVPAGTSGHRWRARLSRIWPSVLLVVVVLMIWEIAVRALGVSTFVLAAPTEIVGSAVGHVGQLASATLTTLIEIVVGFVLSVVVGTVLAVAIARFAWLDRAVYPLVVVFQVVPKVALAPIVILWLGYGLAPKLVLVVIITFFPITLNMLVGMRAVDRDLVLLMRSIGASRNELMRRIQLPTSLPYLFAGLRIGITLAVIGAVVAEFAGAKKGLGYLIQFASTQLDTPLMFAALVAVSVLGLVLFYGVRLVELAVARRYPHIDTQRPG